MLKFSKKTDYAIILLCHLGEASEPVSAQEMAGHYRLPHPMAANILKKLVAVGMAESVRGQRGGYLLSRPAEQIRLTDIVEVMDGPFLLVDCIHEEGNCIVMENCPTRKPLTALHLRIQNFMDETTLASIISDSYSKPIVFKRDHEAAYLP